MGQEPSCNNLMPSLPPLMMSYMMIPFVALGLIPIVFSAIKMVGVASVLSQAVFSFSLIEIISWILSVPIMKDIPTSMALLAFFLIRIIISIVSY